MTAALTQKLILTVISEDCERLSERQETRQ